MSEMSIYRKHIINEVIPYAKKDSRIYLLVCDMGFGVTDEFAKLFPNRILNMGMTEQATVGIASGMAIMGLIPIVYSIVNFLVFRALEQIRNDVILQNVNVKFIGTGANNYFKFLGPSHCCGEDDKRIMELIGMKVFDPYEDKDKWPNIVKEWITYDKASYIRV